jgi:hypothetical protein
MTQLRLLLNSILALLCGCASAPDLVASKYVDPPTSELATLVMFRVSAVPTGIYARMTIDGNVKALLPDGCVTWIQIPAGLHNVAATFPEYTGVTAAALGHNFLSGETYYIEYVGVATESSLTIPIFGSNGAVIGTVGGQGGSFRNKLYVRPTEDRADFIRSLPYVVARGESPN